MSERSMTQNISDNTSSALASQDSQATKVRPVDPEDSQHFQQMLKQPRLEESLEESAKSSLSSLATLLPTLPEQSLVNTAFILSGLPIPAQLNSQIEAINMQPASLTRPVIQQIIDTVVQSMAISTNKDNSQEMRIVLKESILPNTEIRINSTNHQLVVQFITASGSANQWLDQRLFTMQSALERALNRPVDLSLLFTPQDQEGSANQERPYP